MAYESQTQRAELKRLSRRAFLKSSGLAAVGAAGGAVASGAGIGMLGNSYLNKYRNFQQYDELNPNPYQNDELTSECDTPTLLSILESEISFDESSRLDPWKAYNSLRPEDQIRVRAAYMNQMNRKSKAWGKKNQLARDQAGSMNGAWARTEGALIGGGVGAVIGIPTARALEVVSDYLVIDRLKEHRARKHGNIAY